MVCCPICEKPVLEADINRHIDSGCKKFVEGVSPPATCSPFAPPATQPNGTKPKSTQSASFFTPAAKKSAIFRADEVSSPAAIPTPISRPSIAPASTAPVKRRRDEDHDEHHPEAVLPPAKKTKDAHKPLAERMRPQSLDDVAGQELVGPHGVLRNLIVSDRVPSMILWGGPGTGKTTIARLIAQTAGTRFVEINSTSSGVAECKKLFAEARNEMGLTGRKTIIFCDEIHRFSKSQQDVFLGPVEAGQVTLIGATTENPSFKIVNALLSRCRTFVLSKLTDEHIFGILKRALAREVPSLPTPSPSPSEEGSLDAADTAESSLSLLSDDDYSLIRYLAAFADGDARTGLNLLELALDLCQKPHTTIEDIKKSLTQTLVYDRAGDQHYDTISAFHKSVRGSNADATLYYLARMLQSGEDPLYIARRMIVIASEDIGLADNTMLSLATATYSAAEKIGMPECRINLAHCAVALALSPKSVRAYRGLNAAYTALHEPGIAGLPIPKHLRNAPTKLLKELEHGKNYKYNPDYVQGRVVQDYLPEKLEGKRFLPVAHLGDQVDPEVAEWDEQVRVMAEHDEKIHQEEEEEEEEVLLNPDGD